MLPVNGNVKFGVAEEGWFILTNLESEVAIAAYKKQVRY